MQRLARYPLGAEIAASGRDASAVFAASTRVASRLGDQHVDLLVVDSPRTRRAASDAAGEEPHPAVAVLSELHPRLSVQAFNPEAVNPAGWSAQCQPESVPLKSLMSLSAGAVLSLQIGGELLDELRSRHHVEDRASFHRSPTDRAAALAALAGAGVLVHMEEPDPALAERLGADLHGLMASGAVVDADDHEREQISIAMRRCALRDHSLRGRARQLLSASGIDVPVPEVSVLAPTRRPDKLRELLGTVGAQTYPRLELVLGLHGDGFGADEEIAALAESFAPALRIVRVDGALPLGSVLAAAAAAAAGVADNQDGRRRLLRRRARVGPGAGPRVLQGRARWQVRGVRVPGEDRQDCQGSPAAEVLGELHTLHRGVRRRADDLASQSRRGWRLAPCAAAGRYRARPGRRRAGRQNLLDPWCRVLAGPPRRRAHLDPSTTATSSVAPAM